MYGQHVQTHVQTHVNTRVNGFLLLLAITTPTILRLSLCYLEQVSDIVEVEVVHRGCTLQPITSIPVQDTISFRVRACVRACEPTTR